MPRVICLDGYNWDNIVQGYASAKEAAQGGPIERFWYNNHVSDLDNMIKAAASLNDYLLKVKEPSVVVGMSMGTQLAYKWLRDYGPHVNVDPDKVSFVMCAPPENKYGGVSYFGPDVYKGGGPYGGIGLPDDTPFKVHNLIRQWDGVADYPNVEKPSFLATANAALGMAVIHSFYWDVTAAGGESITEGNVTTTWHRTKTLPLLLVPRSTIEKSYRRLVSL